MGGNTASHQPVHETAMDSQNGEDEPRPRVLLVAPRHRYGMDAGGLSTNPQGRGARHRRRDSTGLRGEPGGQLTRPTRSHQIGPLCRSAGTARLYPESGWVAAAAWDSDAPGIMHLMQFALGGLMGEDEPSLRPIFAGVDPHCRRW